MLRTSLKVEQSALTRLVLVRFQGPLPERITWVLRYASDARQRRLLKNTTKTLESRMGFRFIVEFARMNLVMITTVEALHVELSYTNKVSRLGCGTQDCLQDTNA